MEKEGAQTPPLPVFWVKKDVYDTFEKLFLGGKVKGTIDTWEFEKVKSPRLPPRYLGLKCRI